MLVLEGNIPRFSWEPFTTMLNYRLKGTTEAVGVQPGRTPRSSPIYQTAARDNRRPPN